MAIGAQLGSVVKLVLDLQLKIKMPWTEVVQLEANTVSTTGCTRHFVVLQDTESMNRGSHILAPVGVAITSDDKCGFRLLEHVAQ